MPPSGGTITSLKWQARFVAGQAGGGFGGSSAMFGPGTPLQPPDPQPVRVFDFAAGHNYQITPRAYEPFGFSALKAFANVEPVRLAIETRKDQIDRLDWSIKLRNRRSARADTLERIRKVERFFERPELDRQKHFAEWLRESIEQLLVLDAPAWEIRRNRGGEIIGLDIIQGDTIKLNVDDTGRTPAAPLPAYQQIIKGRIWADLSTEDLIYAPRNRRPGHLYGFGPVEQIIVTINTVMRRQGMQLSYFTEGNIPVGIATCPEGWTPDNLQQWQDFVDGRLSGNMAERSKLLWAPYGSKYQAFKEAPLKDDFDEWLYRIVMFAFSLPPTPFIRQMNRSTASEDEEASLEQGNEPLKLWWKRLADRIIQDLFGYRELEWAWNTPREIDQKRQAEIDDVRLKNGSRTINQVRAAYGEEPIPGGDVARIYTATGVYPVGAYDELTPGGGQAASSDDDAED